MASVFIPIVTVLLVISCAALIGLILIQRGKGGGLAAAFGGGGVEQAFGTRAATLVQKATAVLGIIMILLTITLYMMVDRRGRASSVEAPAPMQQPADEETPQ